MAGPRTTTTPGALVVPGVLADIIRDHVTEQQARSAERGTTRVDEAGHLVLLRDATTLAGLDADGGA